MTTALSSFSLAGILFSGVMYPDPGHAIPPPTVYDIKTTPSITTCFVFNLGFTTYSADITTDEARWLEYIYDQLKLPNCPDKYPNRKTPSKDVVGKLNPNYVTELRCKFLGIGYEDHTHLVEQTEQTRLNLLQVHEILRDCK